MRRGAGLVVPVALLLAACGGKTVPKGFSELVLRDPVWEEVQLQVVMTRNENCEDHGNGFISAKTVVMHKGKDQSFDVPEGASMCWRHNRDPNRPVAGDWSDWSRATLYPGQRTETDL